MRKAWAFYLFLILILTVITAIYGAILFAGIQSKAHAFFSDKIKKVEFVDGRIVNMPISHKELQFGNWTIYVDRLYLDQDSIQKDIKEDHIPALFVGPAEAFIVTGKSLIVSAYPLGYQIAFDYPSNFHMVVNQELLGRYKTLSILLFVAATFIVFFIYKFIVGLIYVLVIIAPIVLYKFRRMGLTYGAGVLTGLYLVSIQLIVSTLLLLVGVFLPWFFLIFILFYILYIGALVNIDVSRKVRQSATDNRA
jgi:hypothetical protein